MKIKVKMEKEKHKINAKDFTCRVCLIDNASNNIYYVKIFYNKIKVYCYQMMTEIFSMSVYSGDGLPANICRKCLRILTAAYKLKRLAEESNRQLLLSLSSHSLKDKEEVNIKEETPQTEYTAFENEIKEEEAHDSQPNEDYNEQNERAKEVADASGVASSPPDTKVHCNEDATRWGEVAPAKEEEAPSLVASAPSGIPARNPGAVKCTGKPPNREIVKEHKKVKRKYCMKAERPKRTSRLSASLVCEECGATFGCRNLADKHRRLVHLKEKRYYCDYCNKGYFERPRLVLHIKMHEGRRSFKCPNCSKAYFSRVGLSAHILAEAGVRKFSCHLCPKKFWSKQMLTHHAITHSAVRPFPCRYCAVAYTRKAHRQRHELNVHAASHATEEEKGLKKTKVLVNKNTEHYKDPIQFQSWTSKSTIL